MPATLGGGGVLFVLSSWFHEGFNEDSTLARYGGRITPRKGGSENS
jgi:hypothetical protein